MTGFTTEEIAQAECATAYTDSLSREINSDGQTLEDTLGGAGIEEKVLEYVSLSEAIAKLPERERIVIMLRFFRALTQDKTARIMGISQVQVSRLERRGLQRLRESFRP